MVSEEKPNPTASDIILRSHAFGSIDHFGQFSLEQLDFRDNVWFGVEWSFTMIKTFAMCICRRLKSSEDLSSTGRNGTDERRTGQMQLKSDKMLRERNGKVKNGGLFSKTLVLSQCQAKSVVLALLDAQIFAEETRADQLNGQGEVLFIEQRKDGFVLLRVFCREKKL